MAKKRSIGATVGVITTVVEIGSIIWSYGGRIWGFFKNLFWKPEPPRMLYLWRLGSSSNPAGPDDIEEFSSQLKQGAKIFHHQIDPVVMPIEKGTCYIWRLGDDERPAGPKDIEAFSDVLRRWESDKSLNAIVAHHAVDVVALPGPLGGGFHPIHVVEAGQEEEPET